MLRIGIGASWDADKGRISLPNDYVGAVVRAGALPLLFPLVEGEALWDALVKSADGFVFPGGDDVHPSLFGEEIHPACGRIVPQLDRQELYLLGRILRAGKPFLAICRGAQVLNVFLGGTLYQDLASQHPGPIYHAQFNTGARIAHSVALTGASLLQSLSGADELKVNSRHHQAIKALGHGLSAAAVAPDGIVEAVEFSDGTPGLGVQWHPENLSGTDPAAQALFDWLVREAGLRRGNRG